MSEPTDALRHAKRAGRLLRQASAELAKAADAAEPAAPASSASRVVATFAADPREDPAALARMIHEATQRHGQLDVLLVQDQPHHGAMDGAQEDIPDDQDQGHGRP